MKKRVIAALCLAGCIAMFTGCANTPGGTTGGTTGGGLTQEEEGTLTIPNVYQHLGYAKVKVDTRMDGKQVDGLDLYYDIVDPEICTIENGYVNGLKLGTTDVYAQTIGGQEVKFEVTIKDPQEFTYNREVLTHEEAMRTKFKNVKNPTLFVGDSFFDTNNFWKTFYSDFEDMNCVSVGISGSQTTHWVAARDRLIKPYEPKNIVLHIGTNDINDTSVILTVDQCYEKITDFLTLIVTEYPEAQIYYFGIEDRNGNAGGRNAYSTAVTEKIKTEYADLYENFHYLDTPSVFNAAQSTYVSADNIHPSVKGYELYTKMLKETVEF